ncbi:helix-turn-helix domain-containing protein [Microvirga mediterraneensis]|uniref:Helix-turn-helix domain-containing protein n=1 Tax=Microvirga mediterraneensis TaxID=2754695 RepID=A0A838BN10_9HYPH|nr:helix-turn-helix domain-containing protein [Microvirga mediterraneensis]MBA1156907.1 helix-turn-helix domain-containing protein [Microvirga mediterraneensis]
MKLSQYLSETHQTHAQFALKIGATQAAVSRYASGKRKPNLAKLLRIERATGGKVRARDFVDEMPEATGEAA